MSNAITTKDGVKIYFKDWGKGQPIVFSHGWPLSSDAFEDQMFFLVQKGYRCVAPDRRGFGRSSQPGRGHSLDIYADDLAQVITDLELRDAVLVGHSTGGGEVTRYLARHGSSRVAKLVLISAIPPLLLKTPQNPNGAPMSVFDDMRAGIIKDRNQYFWDMSMPFFGYNRPGAKVSDGVRQSFLHQSMISSLLACHDCVKAFSETDQNEDLKKIDVPTLIIQGDDDQIVPFAIGGALQAKIIKNAKLLVYKGAPHGLCTTEKDRVNADLLDFIKAAAPAKAPAKAPTRGAP
jgi:non-heme chloroperoxidase